MSKSPSRSSGSALGDFITFAGYVQATSNKPLPDCILTLREKPRSSSWFGGYNTRLLFPKTKAQNEVPFEIEYYRQSSRSSRSSHMVQRLKGVMYSENGQTHLVAKVNFTGAGVMWLWLSIAMVLVSFVVPLITGNVIVFMLLMLTAPFMLSMVAVMWLDRYHLTKLVRKSMSE
jgi:hypothetical protein